MTESKTSSKEYILDAAGQKLGRIASETAMILRGKNTPAFKPNAISGNTVKIVNAAQIDLAPVKMEKGYKRYSGYPGGQKVEKRGKLIARKGFKDVFEKAVYGMLPANRLRKRLMKNLTIEE
ncbi:MAG: 50S ribosomal protein L13 [Candidatus Pacebacteria bacterium]|nr:50S ribosomal protein L13 [Candidatus Paceibacterota bacterium]MCD8507880.1 50S ribosomal protein L13 [Candidatus Paceibacterota bacterium]MCD8527954.1 50S ribosomal protein L13 [Candidatus Paceibacterota bacterium]MCD8563931.1 50S ribosomal protein L13 [Candidatus Paceibacterota bacterium]